MLLGSNGRAPSERLAWGAPGELVAGAQAGGRLGGGPVQLNLRLITSAAHLFIIHLCIHFSIAAGILLKLLSASQRAPGAH